MGLDELRQYQRPMYAQEAGRGLHVAALVLMAVVRDSVLPEALGYERRQGPPHGIPRRDYEFPTPYVDDPEEKIQDLVWIRPNTFK